MWYTYNKNWMVWPCPGFLMRDKTGKRVAGGASERAAGRSGREVTSPLLPAMNNNSQTIISDHYIIIPRFIDLKVNRNSQKIPPPYHQHSLNLLHSLPAPNNNNVSQGFFTRMSSNKVNRGEGCYWIFSLAPTLINEGIKAWETVDKLILKCYILALKSPVHRIYTVHFKIFELP